MIRWSSGGTIIGRAGGPVIFSGVNPDIDTLGARSAPADIWPAPGDVMTYPFPAVASIPEFLSDSANDTALGAGARAIMINGLDPSFAPYPTGEIIVMNGVTPVVATRSYMRFSAQSQGVNSVPAAVVVATGSNQRNMGNIIGRPSGGGSTLVYIPLLGEGAGISQTATYTIPLGYSARLRKVYHWIHRTTGVRAKISLEFRGLPDGSWIDTVPGSVSSDGNSQFEFDYEDFPAVAGPADVRVRVKEVSANNVDVSTIVLAFLFRS